MTKIKNDIIHAFDLQTEEHWENLADLLLEIIKKRKKRKAKE